MHNKSITTDNTVTMVGGRNIGDEYFSLNELFNFADMDVLAIGPVAGQVSVSFDAFWNSPATKPVSAFHEEAVTAERVDAAREELNAHVAASGGPFYEAMSATPLSLDLQAQNLEFYWGRITAIHDLPDRKKDLVWIENRDGEPVRHDKEPETTFWKRFGVGFIGLFPVDSQL
jgi:putative cardiolipin synthase